MHNIFLKHVSNCALVIYVKGLACLNKETQSQMTSNSWHLRKYLLKTVYNSEQSMNHHNGAHGKIKSRTLAVIKMEKSISFFWKEIQLVSKH